MNDDTDGSESAIPAIMLPRKIATIETTTTEFYMLRVSGLKEHEAREALDVLRARGYVDS